MSRAFRILVVLILVAAACGGDEGGDQTSTTSGGGGDSTTAAPTTAAPTSAAPIVTDDFCQFLVQYAANVNLQPIGLSPAEVEQSFTDNLNAINQALAIAPNEIEADVRLIADAFGGLNELLSENDYNFFALADADLDDPRLDAFDDPALDGAGDRIANYCGIDNFVATAPSPPPGGGGGGGGGVLPGATLPDDFPAALIPPGGEVILAINVGGADTVTFETSASVDDIVAFYTAELGPPASTIPEPPGAVWFVPFEGQQLALVVADIGGGTAEVNVSFG